MLYLRLRRLAAGPDWDPWSDPRVVEELQAQGGPGAHGGCLDLPWLPHPTRHQS